MRLTRPTRVTALALTLLAILAVPGAATPSRAPAVVAPRPAAPLEVATFAGGCFWCMETQFEGRPGIQSVVSGYTGGHKANPTYEEVGRHATGHYESIEIRFDPTRISYAALLELYWHGIDPTQSDGQFCDRGSPYLSAIFVHGAAQRRQAEESKRRIAASGVLKQPIATRILDATRFYPAEAYHQDFWRKDPERYHSYRLGCGRDRRLAELWGKDATRPLDH